MSINPKFIESICYQRGDYQLIEYHQKRINRTFHRFFPNETPINLIDVLPELKVEERYKVRMIYSSDVIDIEYEQYMIRPINSLKLVTDDRIDYSFKYENRESLTSLFTQREGCDDIMIIKEGHVTDSYYANLAFYDGSKWVTPTTHLLAGVKRQSLLDKEELTEIPISIQDLQKFHYISPINAMLDLAEIKIPIANIVL